MEHNISNICARAQCPISKVNAITTDVEACLLGFSFTVSVSVVSVAKLINPEHFQP